MENKKVVDTAYSLLGVVFIGLIVLMGVLFAVNIFQEFILKH